MIGSSRKLAVWAFTQPVDMRKGYDGLYGIVTQALRRDPLQGDVFLFVSKTRKSCKALLWDGTGLCIYQKRLEQGRFASLWRDDDQHEMSLTMSELQLFLEGSRFVGKIALSPPQHRAETVAEVLASRRVR